MAIAREVQSLLANRKTIGFLDRVYRQQMERIQRALARGLSQPGAARANALLREIDRLTDDLDPNRPGITRNWIKRNMTKAGVLGDKGILLMANHGVATVGHSVAQAYDRLYYMERVAQVQLYAMWTGRELNPLPEQIIQKTFEIYSSKSPQYSMKSAHEHHFAALKRILDRREPDYRD